MNENFANKTKKMRRVHSRLAEWHLDTLISRLFVMQVAVPVIKEAIDKLLIEDTFSRMLIMLTAFSVLHLAKEESAEEMAVVCFRLISEYFKVN